jgi:hypothetical protein
LCKSYCKLLQFSGIRFFRISSFRKTDFRITCCRTDKHLSCRSGKIVELMTCRNDIWSNRYCNSETCNSKKRRSAKIVFSKIDFAEINVLVIFC